MGGLSTIYSSVSASLLWTMLIEMGEMCVCVCVCVVCVVDNKPSQRLKRLLKFPPQGIAMTKFALRGKLVRRLARKPHDIVFGISGLEYWQRPTQELAPRQRRTPFRIAEL